jgi:hypothetical protein
MGLHRPGLHLDQSALYRIKIQGRLNEKWIGYFDELSVEIIKTMEGTTETVVMCEVADQSALHGLLRKIRDLDLPLLLVEFVSIQKKKDEL